VQVFPFSSFYSHLHSAKSVIYIISLFPDQAVFLPGLLFFGLREPSLIRCGQIPLPSFPSCGFADPFPFWVLMILRTIPLTLDYLSTVSPPSFVFVELSNSYFGFLSAQAAPPTFPHFSSAPSHVFQLLEDLLPPADCLSCARLTPSTDPK